MVHSQQSSVSSRYVFTVYDTRTWQSEDFDTNGVIVNKLSWTDDDKVVVIGFANPPDQGDLHLADGRVVARRSTVARLIDPTGQQAPSTTMLLEPHKLSTPDTVGTPGYLCRVLLPDFLNHRAVIVGEDGSVMRLDTRAMKLLNSIGPKNLKHATDGSWGRALSQDGRYLFLLNHANKEQTTSFILDLQTGQSVAQFTSENTWGLALSPNGKTLAIGREREVLLYDLQ